MESALLTFAIIILQIVVALLATSLVCVVGCGIWETGTGYLFQAYLPWESFIPGTSTGETAGTKEGGATAISLLVFFSYLILLNTVVPISLYVRLVYHLCLYVLKQSTVFRLLWNEFFSMLQHNCRLIPRRYIFRKGYL